MQKRLGQAAKYTRQESKSLQKRLEIALLHGRASTGAPKTAELLAQTLLRFAEGCGPIQLILGNAGRAPRVAAAIWAHDDADAHSWSKARNPQLWGRGSGRGPSFRLRPDVHRFSSSARRETTL